jgi:hypothetical protein
VLNAARQRGRRPVRVKRLNHLRLPSLKREMAFGQRNLSGVTLQSTVRGAGDLGPG